jgi:hypothetical protein
VHNLCDIAETAGPLKDSARGLVYDVAAGTLREVGRAPGRARADNHHGQRRKALRANQFPRNCATWTSTMIVSTATQVTAQLNRW